VELKGFTVPHEPHWHASLLLQIMANQIPGCQFDEYLVVDGDEQKIMSIVGFDFFQEC
jgi:hypothetical protein